MNKNWEHGTEFTCLYRWKNQGIVRVKLAGKIKEKHVGERLKPHSPHLELLVLDYVEVQYNSSTLILLFPTKPSQNP